MPQTAAVAPGHRVPMNVPQSLATFHFVPHDNSLVFPTRKPSEIKVCSGPVLSGI